VPRAVVVGSGPNGLAGAVVLARAGVDVEVVEAAATIGGGTRTSELTIPGLLHDECSAFHPSGLASPFFTSIAADLERHGLRWRWPEIEFAHPLDGGRAAVLHRSVSATAGELGRDGAAWQRTFGPLSEHLADVVAGTFRPILQVPRHPVRLARFGLGALQPATLYARRWHTDEARALFAGVAAHAIHPLRRPLTASFALMLGAAGHAYGWPVAEGGSQAITTALAAMVTEHGGTITVGSRVTDVAALDADIVLLDVSPLAATALLGDRLPARIRRAYGRYRYGPAAFKVDLAVEGGVPWTAAACARAGTVHLGGTMEQIAVAEADVHAGRMPRRPFVLVGQQYVCDPSRSVGDVHPVWTYAHVPAKFSGDATEAILSQIERFAPGVRERIVAMSVRGPAELEAHNANYVGGDIGSGANDPWQTLFRPRLALDPYATGVPGVYLCSSATPPGAGVHGMGGYHAARRAVRYLQRR
jgi:phytoene dehydrogenase-like protein